MKKFTFISLFLLFKVFNSVNAEAPVWQWAKSTGGTQYDYGRAICTDASGYVYVAGDFLEDILIIGRDTFNSGLTGGGAILLVKFDPLGNILWAKRLGAGNSDAVISSMCLNSSGHIYLTGSFNGPKIAFGSDTLTAAGNYDNTNIFVAKYDTSGNEIWARVAVGNGNNLYAGSYSICAGRDGSCYITGTFNSSPLVFGDITITTDTNNTYPYYDAFIAKYDSSGTAIWAKSFEGDTGNTSGVGISVDYDNNVYVTGYYQSDTINFDTITLIQSGAMSDQVFIAKYDSSGNALWVQSSAGSAHICQGDCIQVGTGVPGYLYVAGLYEDSSITFGHITLAGAEDPTTFIVKYDLSGNEIWAKNATGPGEAETYGISVNNTDGDLFLTGTFDKPTVTFDSITLINTDTVNPGQFFVVRYDSTGAVRWAQTVGGYGLTEGRAVCVDPVGNVYVTGEFIRAPMICGPDTLNATSIGDQYADIFIAKLGTCLQAIPPINTTIPAALTVDSGHTTTLTASGNGVLSWFSASTGGTYLGSGASYTTGVLSDTTTFFVQDSIDSLCIPVSVRTPVTVNVVGFSPRGCRAYFTVLPDTVPHVWEVINQCTGTAPLVYAWSWGDGSPNSTGPYPTHHYDTAGYYTICVTIIDSVGCTSTYCDSDGYYFKTEDMEVTIDVVDSFSLTVGISSINQTSNIQVFPNPTSGIIYFKGIESGYKIEVYDVLGQMVHSSVADGNSYSINLSGNAKGVYSYRVMMPGTNTLGGTSGVNIQQGKIITE